MSKIAALLCGTYLFFLLSFDKGFAYLHASVYSLPLFVTEMVLASVLLVALMMTVGETRREWLSPGLIASFLLFWIPGLIAVALHPGDGAAIMNGLKRSALFYYSAWIPAIAVIVQRRSSMRIILALMFGGGCLATIINLAELLQWLPGSWPVSVGIANDSAKMFAVLFIVTFALDQTRSLRWALLPGLALGLLLSTSRRSTWVSILMTGMVLLPIAWRMRRLNRVTLRRSGPVVLTGLGVAAILFLIQGPPKALTRLPFYQNRSVTSRPVEAPQTDATDAAPAGSGVGSAQNYERKIEAPTDREPAPSRYGRPESFVERVTRISNSANLGWRALIWIEAATTGIVRHPFLGAGVYEPFISVWVSPYRTPERRRQAAAVLEQEVTFSSRLRNPNRGPWETVMGTYPIPLIKGEGGEGKSPYWYDIDLHNSHLAIFYRFGLVGFAGYAGLLGIALIRLWRGIRVGDRVSWLLFGYLIWYISISSFNVVLEGPFLGVPFWIAIGMAVSSKKGPAGARL